MTNNVFIKNYADIPVDRKEIYRYAGCKFPDYEIDGLIDECLEKAKSKLSFRVCYGIYPLKFFEDYIDLGFAVTHSHNLRKNLEGCNQIIVFGATLGMEFERLLKMTSLLSPAKAVIMQAIGDERVESLCDCFNEAVKQYCKQESRLTKPRFSPGYGDLPLEIQKSISDALSLPSSIGISLGKNLFMTPSKSVTAIIGITPAKGNIQ